MEITLEKIELVKDRTGVSYKEAKDALEAADGSVVDAIINIEESIDNKTKKSVGDQGLAIIDAVKELVKKGNVSKIVVKKKDGSTIINLPVNAGIIATVIAPWGILAAIVAAFGFKCVVEVVKEDGTIIDVSDRANDVANKAVEKGTEFATSAKNKAGEVHEKVKSSDAFDRVKDKASEAFDKTSEAVKNRMNKDEVGDNVSDDIVEEKESKEEE